MSYQVLARKWRPRLFAELVGQSHVVSALTNGLEQGRLHHAFLLTGTRGVGKTTIARILAKSLNCQEGVSAEPCGKCEHCLAIDEGRFVDLLEVDAASRTKVDDTREILDNVQYAPARGRFKVYLIDEVHMLSGHSFNALLKTLEEPPEHVKFVLATTDPQKIPVTILSRCLQFNLRRLELKEIAGQMSRILEAENIEFEAEALQSLARAADGSMRDGLSLLDQALATGGGRLEAATVRDMLGTVEQRHIVELLEALAEGKPADALSVLDQTFAMARQPSQLLADLAEALHRIGLQQQVPGYDDPERPGWEALAFLTDRIAPEDIQLYYQIAVTGRRELELAPDTRTGCEMTLLRMFAFAPLHGGGKGSAAASGQRQAGGRGSGDPEVTAEGEARSGPAGPAGNPAQGDLSAAPPGPSPDSGDGPEIPGPVTTTVAEPAQDHAPVVTTHVESDAVDDDGRGQRDWITIFRDLELSGPVRTVCSHLDLRQRGHDLWVFSVDRSNAALISERTRNSFRQALGQYLGREVRVRVDVLEGDDAMTPARVETVAADRRQARAEQAIEEDPVVQDMRNHLGAGVVRDSIQPADGQEKTQQ